MTTFRRQAVTVPVSSEFLEVLGDGDGWESRGRVRLELRLIPHLERDRHAGATHDLVITELEDA